MAAERLNIRRPIRRILISAAAASVVTAEVLSGGAKAEVPQTTPTTTEAGQLPFVSPLPPTGSPQLGTVPETGPTTIEQTTQPTQANPGSLNPNVYYNPPHDLEKFFIAVNYKIAQIKGVSPNILNTKQKLEGEIAQAWSEGGDINNGSVNNPLNSGLNVYKWISGRPNPSGLQSFKSFEDGVLATAATITEPQYSRLPNCLVDPSCDAIDYVTTLVEYQKTPGNIYWAEADLDSNPAQQNRRVSELFKDVVSVESNYDFYASVEMGTPKYEALADMHLPTSSLVY